jgi:hypothetical protein
MFIGHRSPTFEEVVISNCHFTAGLFKSATKTSKLAGGPSIAHFAIEWGHDTADASPKKAIVH